MSAGPCWRWGGDGERVRERRRNVGDDMRRRKRRVGESREGLLAFNQSLEGVLG